jgi:hypothetical protein
MLAFWGSEKPRMNEGERDNFLDADQNTSAIQVRRHVHKLAFKA